jgi:hypothetical protein
MFFGLSVLAYKCLHELIVDHEISSIFGDYLAGFDTTIQGVTCTVFLQIREGLVLAMNLADLQVYCDQI